MKTLRSPVALRETIQAWRAEGLKTALIPTMGALHEGHLSLVREGLKHADRAIVTLFVNPKQFAANEDLSRYPRDEKGDAAKLEQAGAHLLYAPTADAIYPKGFATKISLEGPAAAGLEDKFRPQFFDGVATIVAKLFIQAPCDFAIFGEKDWQQLQVVTRMAQDLDLPIKIIGVPTMREKDGLAMSSRNAYLTPEERNIAPALYRALTRAAAAIRAGAPPPMACASADLRQFKVDYFEARQAASLSQACCSLEPMRILAAVWLGKTRLIDNIEV